MKLTRFQPTIRHLKEPNIEVGDYVAVPEPKMGWTLVGPLGESTKTYEIKLGLIGDAESLEKTRDLIEKLKTTSYGKDKSFLHVDFPGLSKLRINLNIKWEATIDGNLLRQKIEKATSFPNRIDAVGRIIREKINALMDRDPQPDILMLAYPKIVDDYCIKGAIGRKGVPRKTALEKSIIESRAKHILLDHYLGMQAPPKTYEPLELRSLVKAYCMERKAPIQIIRPHTTESYDPDSPVREDDATTFWNLVVALFYKANYLPWRVKGLLENTSYIGISFFRDRDDPANVKTALAQFFSLDSEGFVFKGDKASVDENNAPHVSRDEAARLMRKAIEVYKTNKGALPQRVVIHKTSRYTEDELQGFQAGAETIDKLDLVAFGMRSIKLVRWGQNPPIRGTMVRLPDKSVLLYTNGYIPYLDVYPGPRVPSPLEILEHHGTTSIETICEEILALTKLNWNFAKFCIKAPITVSFSKRVGNILRNAPPDIEPENKFKFYM
jgi:hypothetical protein